MIRVYLSGGLGNQMFQYATARSLSLNTGQRLIVDNHLFFKKTQSTKRNYELSIFNIDQKPRSSTAERFLLKGYRALIPYQKIQNIYARLFNIYSDKRFKEAQDNSINLNTSIRLFGYFQNEKYFKQHASIIKSDFLFKNILSPKNEEVAKKIKTSNSVSIHIRRGDYLASNSNLSILSLEYYTDAINYIKTVIDNPSFFIFSDDIAWARKNLELDSSSTYIDWNIGNNSYVDMQLMSLCKNNIIANSSFSWWAAWLNTYINKKVIAPSTWYKSAGGNNFEDEFIPSSWTII